MKAILDTVTDHCFKIKHTVPIHTIQYFGDEHRVYRDKIL